MEESEKLANVDEIHPVQAVQREAVQREAVPREAVRRTEDSRRVCLLTTVHPERSLSRALVQHLGQELPDLQFVLSASEAPDLRAIWVCGYEPGRAAIVSELRAQHPEATLVVTGRGPVEAWRPEVLAQGADFVCAWPLPVGRLVELFSRPRGEHGAPYEVPTVAPQPLGSERLRAGSRRDEL
ncbi:MAG: hypothetical protein WD226_05610 [Planctomycetota bacterium]